ncbi:CS domain-containing protein [Aphelenchoides besseyi]|nr:CS domain-containing protein [Aphelenchoides besseyi]
MSFDHDVQNRANALFSKFAQNNVDNSAEKMIEIFFRFLACKTDYFIERTLDESQEGVLEQYEKIVQELNKLYEEQKKKAESDRWKEVIRLKQMEMERKREAELNAILAEVELKTVGEVVKSENKTSDQDGNESEKEDDEEKKEPISSNTGNGPDLQTHSWTQTLEGVDVRIDMRAGFKLKSRDLNIQIGRRSLRVGLKNQPPIIDGELHSDIILSDNLSVWTLESNRIVHLTLRKKLPTKFWP